MPKWMKRMLRANGDANKPERLTFCAPVEFVAAQGDAKKRPTFSINAYNGGPMNVSAFYYPVILDLSGLKAARENLPILLDHDTARVIGQSNEVTIDAKGVRLSGIVTGDDADTQKVVTHASNGFQWQASIGASVDRREFVEAGKTAKVNGREVTGPIMIARAATLVETSFVAIGADQSSSAKVAATANGDTDMNFTEWLKAKGIDESKLDDATKTTLKAAYEAEIKAAAAPVKPDPAPAGDGKKDVDAATIQASAGDLTAQGVADFRKGIADEQKRIAAIQAAAKDFVEIAAKAIGENWTLEKTELEVLKAKYAQVPSVSIRQQQPITPDIITAAACVHGKLPDVEKAFDEKTLQAAHDRYRGRVGLKQMLLEAAWQGGYMGSHFDTTQSGLKDILRAAFSTMSLPGILSNVANKFLAQAFEAVESSWRQIASRRSVPDFKQATSYRLTGDLVFEQVGPDGELKHAELGEASYTNQAVTYGRMYAITRKDIINDDLGALTAVPRRIGRGSALQLNSVFWTAFLADHATFFPTNNSKLNYISGATTVPSIAGLAAAEAAFRRQIDEDGNPLGLMPALVLCPPEQAVAWAEINRSTTVNTGGSSSTTQVPNANVFAGRYPPAVSSYLTSTLEWYLMANPADVSFIEVAFLNGQEAPTVESADADFNVLGVQMRGYFDFGVNKQEYRAAVKSKGAA